MQVTPQHIERVLNLIFAGVYPHYVNKVEKKGRSIDELHQVITWLTGYDNNRIQECIDRKVTFKEFFEKATINPSAVLIKGVICGYRIEDIEHDIVRQARYLDKLVDELAKGKKMEKILRKH